MEVYIVSNNLYENNLTYTDKLDIEKKKMTRPLSVEGEELAKRLSVEAIFEGTNQIFSSIYAGALSSAKYLAERTNQNILIDENLNDCKVGELGTRSLKMVKFMQNHDFNIKLNDGESLSEVGTRIERLINELINVSTNKKVAIFTHRRTMLGYLIKIGKIGYNLDDDLIIEFNEKVIYNESENDIDIIKLTIKERKLVDVDVIDL